MRLHLDHLWRGRFREELGLLVHFFLRITPSLQYSGRTVMSCDRRRSTGAFARCAASRAPANGVNTSSSSATCRGFCAFKGVASPLPILACTKEALRSRQRGVHQGRRHLGSVPVLPILKPWSKVQTSSSYPQTLVGSSNWATSARTCRHLVERSKVCEYRAT